MEQRVSEFKLNTSKDNLELLLTPAKEYVFADYTTEETKQLAADLIQTLYKYQGLGIAGNQAGLPWSVFAFRGTDSDYAVFNPKIVMVGKETDKLEEACLSWPGLIVPIERHKQIQVRVSDYNGTTDTLTFTGLTARVFQHEMCHLQGKHWFEGCSRFHLQRAIKNAKNKGFDYSAMGLLKYAKK